MLFVNVCFCIFVIICVKLGRHGTQDKFQSDLTIKYYLILSYLILCIVIYRMMHTLRVTIRHRDIFFNHSANK